MLHFLLLFFSFFLQVWHCHLPDLKLFTDYIVNVTAVYPGASGSSLTSFMLEDIGERSVLCGCDVTLYFFSDLFHIPLCLQ